MGENTMANYVTAVHQKLMMVQQKLRVPKDRRNTFGKYSFRNASDILEAVKPHLAEVKATIVLQDEVRTVGEGTNARFYIVASATFWDNETGGAIMAQGWAREELDKKGMDAAQLTGACSSYARKYALCGLFAVDDSRLDPDETNKGEDAGCVGSATPTPKATPTATTTKPNPAKPSAEALAATPTPIAKKRVIAHEPNARARAAWQAFTSLDNIKELDKAMREEVWGKTLAACTHKSRASEITTDAEWDKVDSYIKLLQGEIQ